MEDNRGGKREGAGRPKKAPSEFSDKFRNAVMKALHRKAKEMGLATPFDALAELALDPKYGENARTGAWKMLVEMNVVKHSAQSVDVTHLAMPQVYLPEPMQKPPEAFEKEREARERIAKQPVH